MLTINCSRQQKSRQRISRQQKSRQRISRQQKSSIMKLHIILLLLLHLLTCVYGKVTCLYGNLCIW